MPLSQKPFLDEPEFEPDHTHCFGCGIPETPIETLKEAGSGQALRDARVLKYRSLYPLVMLYVSYERGLVDQMKGTNGDYRVCTDCYQAQYAEHYPDFVCPV